MKLFFAIGSMAIAVGLGGRDLVRNWIVSGCLVILTERPYEVGDRVTMAGTSGEIQHIGLRATRITTPEVGLTTIPNSKVLDDVSSPRDDAREAGVHGRYEMSFCRRSSILSWPCGWDGRFDHVRIPVLATTHRSDLR